MQKALELVFEIFNKIINFMFTSYIFDGVSLGMVILVCMLFALMISTIINVPNGVNDVLDRRIAENERGNREAGIVSERKFKRMYKAEKRFKGR